MFGLFKKKQKTNEDGRRPEWADYAAVDILNGRSNNRSIDTMDPAHAPRTVDDGYAVQSIVIRRCERPVAGWKIGCTSRLAQEMLGIPEPFFGPVFKDVFLKGPTWLPPDRFIRPGIEGEIAFTLKRPLESRRAPYSRADVEPAIGKVFAAIEVIDTCFRDFANAGAPNLIADLAANGGLAAFEGVEYEPGMDLKSVDLIMTVNGAEVGRGVGADALGDPVDALVWLANESSRRGIGLDFGQIVSTGTCTGLVWLEPGQQVQLDVPGIGSAFLLYGDDDDFAISEDGRTTPHDEPSRSRATDEPAGADPGNDSNGDGEEEHNEPAPPSTERILKRALCMAAVAIRSRAEETGDVENFRAEFLPWLAREGLEEELEPWERESLNAPQGGLSDHDRSEGLCLPASCNMLAWALGLTDLPRPDKRVMAADMLAPLEFESLSPPSVAVADLLERAQRRSPEEIEYANAFCLAIHWRYMQQRLRPEPEDFLEISKITAWREFDISGPWIVDGDLGFEDVPIHELDSEDMPVAFMLAAYRHKASNWLQGVEPVFSRVPTDT
ncbi:MAG: DUF4272 domain-containing protein [Rhodospirillaceae bacterium]|nr:DUF4272 domain-containing protein [Rhodospirillaceae bacterium]